jgi:hypothetical protein
MKNILVSIFQKSCILRAILPRQEGRIAIVTTRGVGCDGCDMSQRVFCADERRGADGEIVWSWPPGAEVKSAMFMTSVAGDGGKTAGPRGDHV